MMTSFTPGPWKWWTSNSWRRLSSDHHDHPQDGGVLCPCVSPSDGYPDCIVKDADMALIAAAPELYDALENLIGRFEHCCHHAGSDDEFVAEATATHRAALARARGETP